MARLKKELINRIKSVVYFGTEGVTDPFLATSISITNFCAAFAAGICGFFTLFHALYSHEPSQFSVSLVVGLLFSFSIYQNFRRRYQFAMYFLPIVATSGLTVACYLLGNATGLQTLFLTAFSLYYLILIRGSRWALGISWASLLLMYVLIDFNPMGFFNGVVVFSERTTMIFRGFTNFFAILFIIIACYYSFVMINSSNSQKEAANAIIKEQNAAIDTIFNSLNQGIFTVGTGGIIDAKLSRKLEAIIGQSELAGKRVTDLLAQGFGLNPDDLAMIEHGIEIMLGQDVLAFELNQHLFPAKINDSHRHLEFDWNPIVDDQHIVIKILVAVRDVTEMDQIKEESAANRQDFQLLEEIFVANASSFMELYESAENHLTVCRELLASKTVVAADDVIQIVRHLHTLKGEARSSGWKHLSDAVHHGENQLQDWGKGGRAATAETARTVIAAIASALADYIHLYDSKLKNVASANQDDFNLKQAFQKISNFTGTPLEALEIVHELKAQFQHRPLATIIRTQLKSLEDLARQLGKAYPLVQIEDHGIWFKQEYEGALRTIFIHCLQNAIDHGLETPVDRIAAGKSAQGTITITVTQSFSTVVITLADDGRGLDLSALRSKGIAEGSLNGDEGWSEVAQMIFRSGLTTRDHVTEISGRGVGLDAAKGLFAGAGIDVDAILASASYTDPTGVPFYLRITLPVAAAWIPPKVGISSVA